MEVDIAKLFDSYNLKARLQPAFLSAAPVVVTVAMLWPSSPAYCLGPVAITIGVLVFLSTWVRGRGQLIERRLASQWSGLPTTHMLRYRESANLPSFHRRRARLTSVADIRLPSPAEEQANPAAADDQYITATKALIAQVRHHQDWFPLVQEENIQYGFRRNLYAMKPIAVSLLVGNILFDLWWLDHAGLSAAGLITACVHCVLVLAWLLVVRPAWVWQQGLTYADRLFESLEDDRLASGP